jgi:FG-GAP-like repeat
VHRNFFFRNDGTGKFEEVGLQIGAAYNGRGEELGSMGVECGDFDNDGWLDFVQTAPRAKDRKAWIQQRLEFLAGQFGSEVSV